MELFKTSDIQVATVLYAYSVPLLRIEPSSESRKKIFVFHNTKTIDGLITKFWGRKLKVEATMLLTAQRELKRRLYGDSEWSVKEDE